MTGREDSQLNSRPSTALPRAGLPLLLLLAACWAFAPAVEAHGPGQSTADEVARLSEKLKSSDEEERRDAVMALAALRDRSAILPITTLVNDSAEEVRAAAIAALGVYADPSSVPAIAARLARDKSIFVRKTAAYALGRLRTPAATGPLVSALRDKSEEVRGAAAVALGEYEDAAAIGPLMSALSDKNDFVRGRAARALGNNGTAAAAAVPQLIRLLETDRDAYSRQEAVVALGMIGDRSALPALTRASRDPNPHLAAAALSAIESIEKK